MFILLSFPIVASLNQFVNGVKGTYYHLCSQKEQFFKIIYTFLTFLFAFSLIADKILMIIQE